MKPASYAFPAHARCPAFSGGTPPSVSIPPLRVCAAADSRCIEERKSAAAWGGLPCSALHHRFAVISTAFAVQLLHPDTSGSSALCTAGVRSYTVPWSPSRSTCLTRSQMDWFLYHKRATGITVIHLQRAVWKSRESWVGTNKTAQKVLPAVGCKRQLCWECWELTIAGSAWVGALVSSWDARWYYDPGVPHSARTLPTLNNVSQFRPLIPGSFLFGGMQCFPPRALHAAVARIRSMPQLPLCASTDQ